MNTVTLFVAFVAVLAVVAAADKQKKEESSEPKIQSADSRRHGRGRGHWGRGPGFWQPPTYTTPVVDRNVCDLDASVLLVVEGGRHGYNKARRVKCSDVAAADEDSCMICCQNAARRDASVKNEEIFGFLSVVDGRDHYDSHSHSHEDSHSGSHGDDYARISRPKRQAAPVPTGAEEQQNTEQTQPATEDQTTIVDAATGTAAEYGRKKDHKEDNLEDFRPPMQYRNLKCLCCAPRRQLPILPLPIPIAPAAQAQYGAYQAYAQPAAQAPTPYAAAAAPTPYAAAAAPTPYAAAAAPTPYQPAAARPAYSPPVQSAPQTYSAPVQSAPVYTPQAAPAPAY